MEAKPRVGGHSRAHLGSTALAAAGKHTGAAPRLAVLLCHRALDLLRLLHPAVFAAAHLAAGAAGDAALAAVAAEVAAAAAVEGCSSSLARLRALARRARAACVPARAARGALGSRGPLSKGSCGLQSRPRPRRVVRMEGRDVGGCGESDWGRGKHPGHRPGAGRRPLRLLRCPPH